MTTEVFETVLAFRALSDDPDGTDGFDADLNEENEDLDGEEEEGGEAAEEEAGADLGSEMNG